MNKLQIHIKCKKIFRLEVAQFLILCKFNEQYQLEKKKTIILLGWKSCERLGKKVKLNIKHFIYWYEKIYTTPNIFGGSFGLIVNSKNFCSI